MNTRSFIFFTRILARAQISSLTSESFFIEVLSVIILETTKTKQVFYLKEAKVLSVIILETTKTSNSIS